MKIVNFRLETARQVVRGARPGLDTARQLFGDMWELILRKRRYGKQFKRAVVL